MECAIVRENVAYAVGAWNEGVIGIVAARLAERFNKSAFCFNLKDGALKGSGRAVGGVNLIATIQQSAGFLSHFGGHSGAVGLSLKYEYLEKFIDSLKDSLIFCEKIAESSAIEANLNEINMEIVEILERFEPYGNANKMIEFCSNALVVGAKMIKDSHQKLQFKGANLRAILFNNTQDFVGQSVRITYHIKRDFFGEVGICINHIERL